jgi:hypothetical protein
MPKNKRPNTPVCTLSSRPGMVSFESWLSEIAIAPQHPFRKKHKLSCAGIYLIYRNEQLLYIGSGIGIDGLKGRFPVHQKNWPKYIISRTIRELTVRFVTIDTEYVWSLGSIERELQRLLKPLFDNKGFGRAGGSQDGHNKKHKKKRNKNTENVVKCVANKLGIEHLHNKWKKKLYEDPNNRGCWLYRSTPCTEGADQNQPQDQRILPPDEQRPLVQAPDKPSGSTNSTGLRSIASIIR